MTARRLGAIGWITIAWTGMLLAFMVARPTYQAPDELAHVDRVLDTSRAGFQDYDQNRISVQVGASAAVMRDSSTPPPFTAADAPTRPLPNFADLAGPGDTAVPNQLAAHPPAYYAVEGGLRMLVTAWLPTGFWQFDLDVLLMRLISMLMLVPLPWIIWRSAHNLGLERHAGIAAAMVPLCMPQLAHIGTSVNNDNLVTAASSVALLCASTMLARGLSWPTTLGAAAAAALAIQSKVFGLMLVPFLALTCLIALQRGPRRWGQPLVLGGSMALASWTYLRNLVVHGQIYPTVSSTPPADPGFVPDPGSFVLEIVIHTVRSFWGRFGYLWLALPSWWMVAMSLLVLVALAVAIMRPRARHVRTMMIPIGIIGVMYAWAAYQVYLATGVHAAQQGRYVFPVVVSLALGVGAAAGHVPARWVRRGQTCLIGIGFAMSMSLMLGSFWGGAGLTGRMHSIAAWSPLGWGAVAALILGWALLAVGMARALLLERRHGAVVVTG